MEYKGYKLITELDIEPEENCKILHFVTTPEGVEKIVDWSSYSEMDITDFQLWIDLGTPDRMHPALQYEGKRAYSPLNKQDLLKIKGYIA